MPSVHSARGDIPGKDPLPAREASSKSNTYIKLSTVLRTNTAAFEGYHWSTGAIYKRRWNNKERMRKLTNIKYSYMAGSRQHLTCSFMRACLRCLTLVDADVLLLLLCMIPAAVVIMVLLLYCDWLWCCYYCPCAQRNEKNEN